MAGDYGSTGVKRDLEKARTAFSQRNADLSRAAHTSGVNKAVEGHRQDGGNLKSIVYGGVDGILTCFAIISGAAGGNLGPEVVLVIGLSNVLADAVAMGVGDAVSTLSFNEHVENERRRECWEFDNNPEGEIEEMVDLYEQRGLPRAKAEVIITTMAKYRDFFIDIMMCEELGLKVPDEDESPWGDGFVTFLSFLFFGLIPLIAYVLVPVIVPSVTPDALFASASVITLALLFALGYFKSRFSTMKWWHSGVEFMVLGFLVAASSYAIAKGVAMIAADILPADQLHGAGLLSEVGGR